MVRVPASPLVRPVFLRVKGHAFPKSVRASTYKAVPTNTAAIRKNSPATALLPPIWYRRLRNAAAPAPTGVLSRIGLAHRHEPEPDGHPANSEQKQHGQPRRAFRCRSRRGDDADAGFAGGILIVCPLASGLVRRCRRGGGFRRRLGREVEFVQRRRVVTAPGPLDRAARKSGRGFKQLESCRKKKSVSSAKAGQSAVAGGPWLEMKLNRAGYSSALVRRGIPDAEPRTSRSTG